MCEASSSATNRPTDSQRTTCNTALRPRVELSSSPQPRFDPEPIPQKFTDTSHFPNKHPFGTDVTEDAPESQKERRVHWFNLLSWILEILTVALAITAIIIKYVKNHYVLPGGISALIVVYIYKFVRFCKSNTGKYLLHVMDLPTVAEHIRKIRKASPTLMMEGKCFKVIDDGEGTTVKTSAEPSWRFRYDCVIDYSDDLPNFENCRLIKLKLFMLVHFGDEYTKECWDFEERHLIETYQHKDENFCCKRSAFTPGFKDKILIFKDRKSKPALLGYLEYELSHFLFLQYPYEIWLQSQSVKATAIFKKSIIRLDSKRTASVNVGDLD